MLLVPHMILGAAIASKVPNLYLASVLAVLSHFVLDLIPHWEPKLTSSRKKFFITELVDGGIGLMILVSLYSYLYPRLGSVVICVFLSVSVDFFWVVPYIFHQEDSWVAEKIKKILDFLHFDKLPRRFKLLGVITQVLVVLISVAIILR